MVRPLDDVLYMYIPNCRSLDCPFNENTDTIIATTSFALAGTPGRGPGRGCSLRSCFTLSGFTIRYYYPSILLTGYIYTKTRDPLPIAPIINSLLQSQCPIPTSRKIDSWLHKSHFNCDPKIIRSNPLLKLGKATANRVIMVEGGLRATFCVNSLRV